MASARLRKERRKRMDAPSEWYSFPPRWWTRGSRRCSILEEEWSCSPESSSSYVFVRGWNGKTTDGVSVVALSSEWRDDYGPFVVCCSNWSRMMLVQLCGITIIVFIDCQS